MDSNDALFNMGACQYRIPDPIASGVNRLWWQRQSTSCMPAGGCFTLYKSLPDNGWKQLVSCIKSTAITIMGSATNGFTCNKPVNSRHCFALPV
jgi:hypothetical protein